jgi:hypothetical protein
MWCFNGETEDIRVQTGSNGFNDGGVDEICSSYPFWSVYGISTFNANIKTSPARIRKSVEIREKTPLVS